MKVNLHVVIFFVFMLISKQTLKRRILKMKTYELLAIFKPNLDAEETDKMISKINDTVAEFGGKVESTDKIGRKKLAYDIQNFRDGFFTSIVMELPADKVAEFKRQLRLNDNILRTMFLEVSKKASV